MIGNIKVKLRNGSGLKSELTLLQFIRSTGIGNLGDGVENEEILAVCYSEYNGEIEYYKTDEILVITSKNN